MGISNTHNAELTTGVLRRALAEFGTPKIFNTDQGSEFTANEFTSILETAGIRISMDGKGRTLDNIFVERFCERSSMSMFILLIQPHVMSCIVM